MHKLMHELIYPAKKISTALAGISLVLTDFYQYLADLKLAQIFQLLIR